jgi:hypothetical protein
LRLLHHTNMKKVFLLIFLLLVSLNQCFAQQKTTSLTNKDKAIIVKSILLKEDFLNRGLGVDETKEIVNLSLENITPEVVPKIPGIKFVLFNQEQIKEKIKTSFRYYAFGRFGIKGSKVLVDFGNYFPSYSNGSTYEFKRVKGKWIGKLIGGFASDR